MKKIYFFLLLSVICCSAGSDWGSAEEKEEVNIVRILAEIEQNYYDYFIILQEVRASNEKQYNELLRTIKNSWPEFQTLERQDPQRAKLEVEIQRLDITNNLVLTHYHQAVSDTDRDSLKKQLRQNLDQLFDLKIQKRKNEIETLEKELKKLKDELTYVQNRKKESIGNRLKQMTAGDVFNW